MLRNPNPSSPTRKPVEHLYFRIIDGDNVSLNTRGFSALYAAARWVQYVIEDQDINWLTPNEIEIQRNNKTLNIRGTHLEDLVEYELNGEEQDYFPEYPDDMRLKRIKNFYQDPPDPKPINPKPINPKPTTNPSRYRTQKQPDDPNQVTVAQLAVNAGISPNKARQILRKNNIAKPGTSWTFNKDDPIVKQIQALFGSK